MTGTESGFRVRLSPGIDNLTKKLNPCRYRVEWYDDEHDRLWLYAPGEGFVREVDCIAALNALVSAGVTTDEMNAADDADKNFWNRIDRIMAEALQW